MNKFLIELKFIWKAHITNWMWRDRRCRRNVRGMALGEKKLAYLKKYIPFIKNLKSESVVENIPFKEEKAFSLWIQGSHDAPFIVSKCLDSIKSFFGDQFIVLDNKTIHQYVQLPDYITEKWEQGKMIPAHYSDIVRLELLYKYGGYWFDATDFMVSNVPEKIIESDFFVISTSEELLKYTFIQNYFIRAKKGDPLLAMWRDLVFEYWKQEEKASAYYLVQLLFKLLVENNSEAKELYEKMPKIDIFDSQLLWQKYGNLPFDKKIQEEILKRSFFQKCTYKRTCKVKEILPGSVADYFINKKI